MRWRNIPIDGLEKYQVSENGDVRVKATKQILKPDTSSDYNRVNLVNTSLNKQKKYANHILTALSFVEGYEEGLIVNHINGNKRSNHYTNLVWCTYSENLSHAFKNKLRSQDGENNPANKYPKEVIIKICSLLEKGFSMSEIREKLFSDNKDEYDNYRKLINGIKRREKWNSISIDFKW